VFLSNDKSIAIKTTLNEKQSYKDYEKQLEASSGIFINPRARIVRPIVKLEEPEKGYVMRFLEGGKTIGSLMEFKGSSVSEILNEYNASGGLKRRLLLLKDLAETLHYIHTAGAVYGDISDKNVYVSRMRAEKSFKDNPQDIQLLSADNTKIQLIDSDNLTIGHLDGCLFTPGYGAPEVVRKNPNTAQSDMYSFALLSYILLNINNPFDGVAQEDECWDAELSEVASESTEEGGKAFIYDRSDTSNHAGDGTLPWKFGLTENLLVLFEKAFGYKSRTKFTERPSAAEWFVALSQAVENVYYCKKCDAHHYPGCAPCKTEYKTYYAIVDDLSPEDEGYRVVGRRKVVLDGRTEIVDDKIRIAALKDIPVLDIEPQTSGFVISPCKGYEIAIFEGERKINDGNRVSADGIMLVTNTKISDEYAMRITFERI
jgi:serine/threonine protein kinase